MRVPFRERDPLPLGLAALATIVVIAVLALNLQSIPFFGGGRTYHAAFAEAAGLKSGEEVRIAGVKVGKVTGLGLDGDHVKVDFQIDDGVRIGDLSRVEIKIKTLLGAHYLAVDPRGPDRQDPSKTIPVSRTSTPFEIVPAISELSQKLDPDAGGIDTAELAKSFDVLSDTFKDSPEEIKASLQGLRRLSTTISSRDDELHQLLGRSASVTQVLADRNQEFTKLITDGDKILQAVSARRAVIHQLLVNTVALSAQINALIGENQAQIGPMLANLQRVNKILLKNQGNLDRTIALLAPFATQFTDATGTGRWFDSYIQNLIPVPASLGQVPSKGGTPQKSAAPTQPPAGGQGNPTTNPLPFLP